MPTRLRQTAQALALALAVAASSLSQPPLARAATPEAAPSPASSPNSSPTSSADLAPALDQAWLRDPQAAWLQARQAELQAALDLAHGLIPGPASVSASHLGDQWQAHQGRREWELEIGAPMWLPGQRDARQHSAAKALAALQARIALRRLSLAGELREAWWALARAQADLELAQQREQTAQALAEDVARRVRGGDLPRLDANLAQTELLRARAEALEADIAVRQRRLAWQTLTGAAAPRVLAPEAMPASITSPPAGDNSPLATHPRWLAVQAASEQAASDVALADASQRAAPELAMRWNSQRNDAFSPADRALGIKVTIPLSSTDKARQDSAAARAAWAQADSEQAQARASLAQEAALAYAGLDAATQQLALAEQRRALTADSLGLSQRAFHLGEMDLASLLRAKALAHEAQAWFAQQQIARYAALSRLQQALGLLPGAQP